MDMIYWDHYYNTVLFVNLAIVIGLFACLRFFSGIIAHINASDELLRKDNPAFGISLAGATLAIAIVLTGTIFGTPEGGVVESASTVLLFGMLGIVLMALTRMIFSKVTLSGISLRNEIMNGNVAVAICDAGNVVAAAIIIRAVMIWVPETSLDGLFTILGGYAVSQILLTGMGFLKIKGFSMFHKGHDFHEELRNGNKALALRFTGMKIGAAFAIATAAQIVVYEEYNIVPLMIAWFAASIVVILVWKLLCIVAERLVLFRVDFDDEVIRQKNVALGVLQAVIYISLGLLISAV